MPATASKLKRSAASTVRGWISRLPAPRDRAAYDLVVGARGLVTGKVPGEPKPPVAKPRANRKTKVRPYGTVPGPRLQRTPRLPEDTVWTPFPESDTRVEMVRSLYETGARPERMDVDLLDRLNEEYAAKRIVKAPRSSAPKSMQEAARGRVAWAHTYVDLRDTSVLEIGCGRGYEVFIVGNDYGSRAHGIDVREYSTWSQFASDKVGFTLGDMSQENPFEHNSFDRIISYTVWEHVTHPRKLLEETYNVLKPGGLAWIRANLYAGPAASHRYRDIFFPWPHLLFSDDVIRDWDVKHGLRPRGASWVNRLSWGHYERYIAEIGFNLRHLSFQEAEWDQEFYERFEDILGRFPITDLKRDYFLAVLEKPLDGA